MSTEPNISIFKHILLPFVTYVFLFVGMGFIAGGIVHLGDTANVQRYLTIGGVGIVLFLVGSYVQETIYNNKTIQEEGLLSFLFFSFLLSLGIGMISGGTQHFADFSTYASTLIPVGIILSLIAFIKKHNIQIPMSSWIVVLTGSCIIGGLVWMVLSTYASTFSNVTSHSHEKAADTPTHMTEHHMTVTNDKEFLIGMIPHHQEAVDTSAYVLTRTQKPELQTFLKAVIDVQSEEINQMKIWYNTWFDQEYKDQHTYVPMMRDLTAYTDTALEQAYIRGMITHHKGAIDMAKQIAEKTSRPEIQRMAQAIIETQTKEVSLLESWITIPESNNAPDTHMSH